MSLRILIGHSLPGQRGTAQALYVGDSGSDLETTRAKAPAHIGSFSIINNPLAIRKSNAAYNPGPKAEVEASEVEPPEKTKPKAKK